LAFTTPDLLRFERRWGMSLDGCKAALKRLREIRNGIEARQGQKWPRKSSSGGPALLGSDLANERAEASDRLARVGADFANELADTNAGAELAARAARFQALTGPGSAFDTARQAAHDLLQAADPGLYLPDYSQRSWRSTGSAVAVTGEDGSWTGEMGRDVGYENYLWEVRDRLAGPDWARWHLATALDDVERGLGMEMSRGQRQVFEAWQKELWAVSKYSERERLLGSFVLAESRGTQDPSRPDSDRYHSLLHHLMEDLPHLTEETESAATLLSRLAKDPPSEPARQEEGGGGEAKGNRGGGRKWFHEPDEPRSDDYKFGPLAGTQTELAKAICRVMGKGADRRGLHQLGADGVIWAVKHREQFVEVYFKDMEMRAAANAKLIEERNKPKRTRNAQYRTEGE
jgi:hypothetical protein